MLIKCAWFLCFGAVTVFGGRLSDDEYERDEEAGFSLPDRSHH
jgi:hypothetical protein